ncbi:hypothetical protein STEG23_008865 [Scotinomys teguina]
MLLLSTSKNPKWLSISTKPNWFEMEPRDRDQTKIPSSGSHKATLHRLGTGQEKAIKQMNETVQDLKTKIEAIKKTQTEGILEMEKSEDMNRSIVDKDIVLEVNNDLSSC